MGSPRSIKVDELGAAPGPRDVGVKALDEVAFIEHGWPEDMLDQLEQGRLLEQLKKYRVPIRQTIKAPVLGVRIDKELTDPSDIDRFFTGDFRHQNLPGEFDLVRQNSARQNCVACALKVGLRHFQVRSRLRQGAVEVERHNHRRFLCNLEIIYRKCVPN
jgi:hypothetical protein